jgi:aminobenzoyl-glutamate utilization protein A
MEDADMPTWQNAGEVNRAIAESVRMIGPDLARDRRDVHRHAESAWTEFWTTSLIARRLIDLGY